MRLVVDTNVFVSAALKESPYRSSLPAGSTGMTVCSNRPQPSSSFRTSCAGLT